MGTTKSEIFTSEQNELAALAKAMGHPARIAIIQYLIKTPQCVCGNLVDEIGLAQSTVSQHLKELKKAGLIQGTVEGVSVCYCLDPDMWQKIKTLFNDFMDSYQEPNSCC